ncbi:MAG: pyridoxamine kinase [Ruminococcaceae bacterium]|nr:pyridoxamine kinase [Oscillospiraceae bacterium]
MKKIAVVNDISGFGRCSLTAALPIISSFGVQCCPLVTGVYSNQTGYDSYKCADLTSSLPLFIDEWKKLGVSFDAIITGFVTSGEQGRVIADFVDEFGNGAIVVTDPIMADDGEVYDGFDVERINAVKALAKKADVITPNLHELCILAGREFSDSLSNNEIKDMSAATGNKTVITTGIKRGNSVVTAVYSEGRFETVTQKKLGNSFSGTGDILVSFVTAAIVSGDDVFTAVQNACDFIGKAIELTLADNPETPYRAEGIYFEKLLSHN